MADLTPAARVAAVKALAVALLPVSASPREKALLAAELARLSLYEPEAIASLWDPESCPASLLPWLAWALSVDVWDATWPESVRRAVVAAAPGVHRLKGTRAAVQRSLDALSITTDIIEWWETEPPGRRGTANVTAYVGADYGDDAILSERIQRQAIASIRAAKPKSRTVTYRIGVGMRSRAGMLGAHQAAIPLRKLVEARAPDIATVVGAIGITEQAQVAKAAVEVFPANRIRARFAALPFIAGVQFVSVCFAEKANGPDIVFGQTAF